MGKVAFASFVGTAIEFYDFYIYGTAAALVLGSIFFPEFSLAAGTLAAFATFAVAYVARPLGGVVLGHFGDRVGRKAMLIFSLLIMGAATVLISLLSGYVTTIIGVAAPFLLVVFALLAELRPRRRVRRRGPDDDRICAAGQAGPLLQLPPDGPAIGFLLANWLFLALAATLSNEQLAAWGCRVPFVASLPRTRNRLRGDPSSLGT